MTRENLINNLCFAGLLLWLVCSMLMLGACASFSHQEEPLVIESLVQPRMPPVAINGTIYSAGTEMTLFEDIKARRIGDILTVLLVEQNSGTKSSDTNVNQSTAASLDPPILGTVARTDIGLSVSTANKFAGTSGSSQSNNLTGSVTVTVIAVLPGGNLRVQGEKWIEINQGKEYIHLEGIIRPKDVRTNNTILSTQVADARITYSGKGAVGSVGVMGWLSRVLFSPLRPF